ncbi:uncharacterized protein LOC113352499 [Papaver somniferum]|uniref:uncharacterized protein LOC113352499 n=1 Tax=Papaver somniferum TaxID=3469 RepID=UPI000E7052D1|nr:uncharacterized protein LOC113352499 [Papaver somniferum]
MASAALQIGKDIDGMITFISRWCMETHTAICRWGEMTITLESVAVLLNLPIIGNLDVVLSEEEEEMHATLVRKSEEYVRKDNEEKFFYTWWVSEWFPKETETALVLDDTLHVAAFLSLWLSRDIFDDGSGMKEIRRNLINFAIKLAKGVALPIGSLFLGSLYTHLDCLAADMYASNGYMKVDSYIHVAFLQVWLWEHFKHYAHNPMTSLPDTYGGSRILQWSKKRPRPRSKLVDFLDNMNEINFRPWTPVHASIVQPNTFASAPDITLHSDGVDITVGDVIFM